ncbi:MAG: hypothetical protein Q8L42_14555 [Sulfurimicrobium sp.]|nr:hypothetical protein [Sulfurimicrobium sp.]MDP1705926.1 hypothetical protein [Sulfurimicrobium sp.]
MYENDYPAFVEYSKTSTIEVLQQPEHGDMTRKTTAPKLFQYTPNTGYKGTDKAVFLVTLGEHKVKVIYFIKVIDTEMTTYNHEAIYRKYCPKPTEWLISSEQGGSPLLSQFLDFSGLLGRVNLSFADLPGTAVAQTTARVGRNNQRALRRMKNLPILAPCLIIDAPGTRAAQKPPSVI